MRELKKFSLRQASDFLSEAEMKNVIGGRGCAPGESYFYCTDEGGGGGGYACAKSCDEAGTNATESQCALYLADECPHSYNCC